MITPSTPCAGHMVYHGPRESVLDFFEPLGFRCPERKGIADFLQEVAPPACFPCTQTQGSALLIW